MSTRDSTYQSSPQKDIVRDNFDLPLLLKFRASKGKKLKYFGMPGADCLDIQAWRDVLDEVVAVERHCPNLFPMEDVLGKHFRDIRTRVHFGDVDDIILAGRGKKREIRGKEYLPNVANDYDPLLRHPFWRFDVVYLDYFGEFLPQYRRRYPYARGRRDQALRHLFVQDRLDARESWVLMVTFAGGAYPDEDVRHLVQYLESAKCSASDNVLEVLDYLLSSYGGNVDHVTRLVHGAMALLVSSAASNAKLEPRPVGTVSYVGSNNHPMVHFAFRLNEASDFLGHFANPLPLLRAPILRPNFCEGIPSFDWAQEPCPGTTTAFVRDCLQFLDTASLDHLVSYLPA